MSRDFLSELGAAMDTAFHPASSTREMERLARRHRQNLVDNLDVIVEANPNAANWTVAEMIANIRKELNS